MNLNERVFFFGFAEEEELKCLLANCILFAYPSAIEGFGLPVAEAMACGAPIVCFSNGSLPEIAGDAAVLSKDATPQAFATAMQIVIDNPSVRAELQSAGLERAKIFNWQSSARQLTEIYKGVSNDRRR